ncbi:TonB-dependent receptor [Acinetobacter wuhouensis]|uniref:zinc piracy TonB-dependent receptor ZnuD n=1 Tax=Acinetobacter wuhouensis TaxID=1879050 RepID=UPI00083B076D|nr:zinc piracy TonB-dependent receptor ZnuD [Acinetobacter wuhouensis]AXQ21287.1 TonB-dependent receptor [Acinetobacter wuhouensis]
MSFSKSVLTLSITAVFTTSIWADDQTNSAQVSSFQAHTAQQPQQLETIKVTAHPLVRSDKDFGEVDETVSREKLQQAGTTIGEALKDELGVYSNSFGSGSSRPVIRGQDGARVKVTQNATESMDVSSLSPDHAVTVDPQLAQKVEVIRGPSTLLYGAGSVGGLVNVVDTKIPTVMPENSYEGNVGVRYNSGNDEKLGHAGVTLGLGSNVALRVEGLKREANDYITPNYSVIEDHGDHTHTIKERRVGNTFSESDNVNVGLSWIGERGFAGVSYSNRQDKYGLPGHSHEYESCHPHGDHLHCGGHDDHDHSDEHEHSAHDEHDHDHSGAGPWIDMKTERYDFRSELNEPFAGFKKLRAQASYTDYQHDEIEGSEAMTTFESKAYEGRIELVHNPIAQWEGVWGVQASQQKLDISGEEAIFAPNKTQKYSLFGLEHRQFGDVHVELGTRFDHQKIEIDSKQKNYDGNAISVSGAANWEFKPDYTLSLSASHQQRLPTAQELYSNGGHFATNTYELGNENLDKEKSNNVELGLHYEGDQLSYHVHVYHNWFDHYIYAKTLDQYENFRLIEYRQADAKFYGTEAEVAYQWNDTYNTSLFGDYVRGKIEDENAPRVPAGRLGTRVKADFDEHWSGSAEYYHVFNQDKFAAYEAETKGYNMVNVGVAYKYPLSGKQEANVFFNANNLLDETVYEHTSFLANIPQIGRNFVVGVNYKF